MSLAELQVCPPSVLQKTPARARRRRVPAAPRHPSSSDDNSHPGLAIEFAPPPVDAEPDDAADVSSSDSNDSVGDEPDDLLQDIIATGTGCLCLLLNIS